MCKQTAKNSHKVSSKLQGFSRGFCAKGLVTACLGFALAGVGSNVAAETVLQSMQLKNNQSASAELLLDISAAPEYRAFSLLAPDRFVLDLLNAGAQPIVEISAANQSGLVRSLRHAEKDGRNVRIVVDLAEAPAWTIQQTEVNGKTQLQVILTSEKYPQAVDAQPAQAAEPAATSVKLNDIVAETPKQHTVARGETLYSIAKRYQVELSELRQANKLNNNIIQLGQSLRIPGKVPNKTAALSYNPVSIPGPAGIGERHTVKSGETLFSISKNYGVSVEELRDANKIKDNIIHLSDVLLIPGTTTIALPAPNSTQPVTSPATSTATSESNNSEAQPELPTNRPSYLRPTRELDAQQAPKPANGGAAIATENNNADNNVGQASEITTELAKDNSKAFGLSERYGIPVVRLGDETYAVQTPAEPSKPSDAELESLKEGQIKIRRHLSPFWED